MKDFAVPAIILVYLTLQPSSAFAASAPTASDMPTMMFDLGILSVCNEHGFVSKDDLSFFVAHIKADADRFGIPARDRDLNWTRGRAELSELAPPNAMRCQNYFMDLDSKYPHPDDSQPMNVEQSPLN